MKLNLEYLQQGKFVVAVSGGVDSVVLLELLSQQPDLELVVAHFDHGIRADSEQDCKFVAKLAKNYNLEFISQKGDLGPDASEVVAREQRYKFLKGVQQTVDAKGIVTAHHQDDVIETLIINLLRGTGRRGITSLSSEQQRIRPLLAVTKSDILAYAKLRNLEWREDSTNTDTTILRNYVRRELLPKMRLQDPEVDRKLLSLHRTLKSTNKNADIELMNVLLTHAQVSNEQVCWPRSWFVMLPEPVATELVYEALHTLKLNTDIDKAKLKRAAMFGRTGKLHKKLSINKLATMTIHKNQICISGQTP